MPILSLDDLVNWGLRPGRIAFKIEGFISTWFFHHGIVQGLVFNVLLFRYWSFFDYFLVYWLIILDFSVYGFLELIHFTVNLLRYLQINRHTKPQSKSYQGYADGGVGGASRPLMPTKWQKSWS